jgi:predicted nucleotidyltransferase
MKSFDKAPLVKREMEAIETAARRLKDGFSIESVILFGSKARGDADAHSDIDLLLISSKGLHWRDEKAIVDSLFDIGMEYDVIFSPLFISLEEWEKGLFKAFPIYDEITREGAVVA